MRLQVLLKLLALLSLAAAQPQGSGKAAAAKPAKAPTSPSKPTASGTRTLQGDKPSGRPPGPPSDGKPGSSSGAGKNPVNQPLPPRTGRTIPGHSPSDSGASSSQGASSSSGAGSSNQGAGSSSGAGSSQGPAHHPPRHRVHRRPLPANAGYPTAAVPGYNHQRRRQDGNKVKMEPMRPLPSIPENSQFPRPSTPQTHGALPAMRERMQREGWQFPSNGDPIPPPNFQIPGNSGSPGAGSSSQGSSAPAAPSSGISAPAPTVGTSAAGSTSGAGTSQGTSPVGSSSGMSPTLRAQLQREGWTFPENGKPIPPPNLFRDNTELRHRRVD
ncbi:hypothetical protein MIR68_002412 [Amoeboaphelidium protococcarum]|nr:hypothetical protein MIR68_002412 [Amoeboaphelidium protococcarum]